MCDRVNDSPSSPGPTSHYRDVVEVWQKKLINQYVLVDEKGVLKETTLYYDPNLDAYTMLRGHKLKALGTLVVSGISWYLLPQNPPEAVRMYNSVIRMSDFRNPKSSVPWHLIVGFPLGLVLTYVLSIELADEVVTNKLRPIVEARAQGKWFSDEDEFGWFFHTGEKWPRGQWSALLMCAEVMSPGDWQRGFRLANDESRFCAPTVRGVDFPSVGLSQAFNEAGKLFVSTYAATKKLAGKPTSFQVTNLPEVGSVSVECDGVGFADFEKVNENTIQINTKVGEYSFVINTGYLVEDDGSEFVPLTFESVA